jgi:hypothetical protein
MAFRTEATRERDVESYCMSEFKKRGWLLPKWVSVNNRAVPDRIALLPFGVIKLIEFKAPGKEPTPLQKKLHEQYAKLGHTVHVIDSKFKVDLAIARWEKIIDRRRQRYG